MHYSESLMQSQDGGGGSQERRRQPLALLKNNIMPPLSLTESTLRLRLACLLQITQEVKLSMGSEPSDAITAG